MTLYSIWLNPLIQTIDKTIIGIRTGKTQKRTVRITYKNDVTVFLTWEEDIHKLEGTLRKFEEGTGKKVNVKKFRTMTLGNWNKSNNIMNIPYLLTYLLTPRCRVLPEKLTGLQLVKKFRAFHGTRRFITALTSVRHLSLSCASPIQSIHPHPTSCRSILILSTHLRLGIPSGLLPSDFPTKTLQNIHH